MAAYRLPYGKTNLEFELPDSVSGKDAHAVEVLALRPTKPVPDPGAAVKAALRRIALPPSKGGRCIIAVNDRTRPVPHRYLLPPLLEHLEAMGTQTSDIALIIATGTHPVMPPEQFVEVIPEEILRRYRVICHDAYDRSRLAFLGNTSRGTPIWVNREFLEAEVRIVVGVIGPHQFVGFSGGVKSASIGLAGEPTVTHNHSMMTDPQAQIGRYEDNPCRQDIEEIGRRIGVHAALNAVLDEGKNILQVLAGDPERVMREGMVHVRRMCECQVEQPFDLTIASPGGHPKDVNLYQAQKALAHAALVTRPGGTIFVTAACPEGTGSRSYEEWVCDPVVKSHEDVVARFTREGYRIGPHKAFQISRDAARFSVLLYSEMPPELVRQLLLTPAHNFQEELGKAVGRLAPGSRIGILPRANSTIPILDRRARAQGNP